MRVTLICSCGLLLQSGGQTLLVDAPNGPQAPFFEFPEQSLQALIDAQPPFDGPVALAFTHMHPDHFCRDKLSRILAARPKTQVFLPSAQMPDAGKMRLGGFTLEFHCFAHTPVPENLMTEHAVLLIECEGVRVYITSDAAPDVARHRQILGGRVCDAAFWNGQYLSHAATRALMQGSARENYIYHVPVDAPDASGIRRKCDVNLQRFSEQLHTVTVLRSYPQTLLIQKKQ